jgi:hypothetical protein
MKANRPTRLARVASETLASIANRYVAKRDYDFTSRLKISRLA